VLAIQHLLPGLAEDLLVAGAHKLNTGQLPWLSPYGWMPTTDASYDVYSLSRPRLESLVRRRVAMALPIEDDRWLILENGYGDQRPGRDVTSFEHFLATLPDPALSRLVAALEPDGDVAVHRQTGNQRRAYGRRGAWPSGLLVVGDSLCAFNPIYGQGITVAACQAEVLQKGVGHVGDARSTRRLQQRISAVTNFPWAVSTSEDLRYPDANGRQDLVQRLMSRWTDRVSRLAVGGDTACLGALADTYHLMGSPARMFGPRVTASVLRSLVGALPAPSPRPAVLDQLTEMA